MTGLAIMVGLICVAIAIMDLADAIRVMVPKNFVIKHTPDDCEGRS